MTGKDGQVGWELQQTLAPLGKIFALDRQGFDLQNPDQMRKVIREVQPHVIVNAAAYTAVDKAETDQEAAWAVNAAAPGVLAEEAKKVNALLVHYSTDYVFDGKAASPYKETDETGPLNEYGRTKLEGEKAIQAVDGKHLILRTSWVYGMRGKNFLLTMLKLGKERAELKIVGDQIGAPTWSRTVAEATAKMVSEVLNQGERVHPLGIYNLSSAGRTSWYGFAEAIFELYREILDSSYSVPKLQEICSADYPTPVLRPQFCVLSHEKILKEFQVDLPEWKEALRLCLEFELARLMDEKSQGKAYVTNANENAG